MSTPDSIDTLYQQAVDEMAKRALDYGKSEIFDLPDDDIFIIKIAGQEIKGWMRYIRLAGGLHHVIFSLTRKTLLVVYKLYLSGVKVGVDGSVSLLSEEEVAGYD